ncbi:preprotein translocase subunit SecE [Limibacter armeniacum]|uniref:preprotein translocase subunit SecE n=1 Tax=Limibacter armeniacum TaxID=466084 RepID=UPI002FE63BF7
MNKFVQFLRESYTEMTENVTWSSFSELQQSSILVLVSSLIFALVIGLADTAFNESLSAFYNSFKF